MEQPRVLIADCREDFLLSMDTALQSRCHVTLCSSGKKALALLRSQPCDLLLLDLMLPELDGISLLEILHAEGLQPMVIAVTALINTYVIDSVQRLNVAYLIRKPCDLEAVAARIDDLLQEYSPRPAPCDDRRFVSDLLTSLSVKSKHVGFHYLLEAILAYAKHPEQSFTKELYPAIGKPSGRSGKLVERSIRSALDSAWAQREEAVWLRYFPAAPRRPTAAAFITALAQTLRCRNPE